MEGGGQVVGGLLKSGCVTSHVVPFFFSGFGMQACLLLDLCRHRTYV